MTAEKMNFAALYPTMGSSEEAKAILAPFLRQFHKLAEARDYDKLAAFYDPNAVIVHAGKDVVYGREALKKDLEEFLTRAGRFTPKSTNHYYRMCEDFIILTADYATVTEKMGVLKGRVTQIWRKCDGEYLMLHLEDAPTT